MTEFTGDWYTDLYILEELLHTVEYNTASKRLKNFGIKRSVGGSVFITKLNGSIIKIMRVV